MLSRSASEWKQGGAGGHPVPTPHLMVIPSAKWEEDGMVPLREESLPDSRGDKGQKVLKTFTSVAETKSI